MHRRRFVYREFSIQRLLAEKEEKIQKICTHTLFEQSEPSNMTKAKKHICSYKNRIFRIGIGNICINVCVYVYIIKIVDNAHKYKERSVDLK